MADLLSQQIVIGLIYGILSSSRRCFIHITSSIPFDMALNSASVLDFDITLCFLLLRVTRFPPSNVQYPLVDL